MGNGREKKANQAKAKPSLGYDLTINSLIDKSKATSQPPFSSGRTQRRNMFCGACAIFPFICRAPYNRVLCAKEKEEENMPHRPLFDNASKQMCRCFYYLFFFFWLCKNVIVRYTAEHHVSHDVRHALDRQSFRTGSSISPRSCTD